MNLNLQLLTIPGEKEILTVNDSLMVMVTGLVVVFAVLALLVAVVEVLHFVLKDRKQTEEADAVAPAKSTEAEQRISAGIMAEVPEAQDAAGDSEFIAAISAAISVVTGKPNGTFKIKSIKKG